MKKPPHVFLKVTFSLFAIIVIVPVLIGYLLISSRLVLVVSNETDTAVRDVSIFIGRKNVNFGELSPGETKTKRLLYSGDSSTYRIRGVTVSGRRIHEEWGYVTYGSVSRKKTLFEFQSDGKITISDFEYDQNY